MQSISASISGPQSPACSIHSGHVALHCESAHPSSANLSQSFAQAFGDTPPLPDVLAAAPPAAPAPSAPPALRPPAPTPLADAPLDALEGTSGELDSPAHAAAKIASAMTRRARPRLVTGHRPARNGRPRRVRGR